LARRSHNRLDRLEDLLVQVTLRLANTPLAAIGQTLTTAISDVQTSVASRLASPEAAVQIAGYVGAVLELLPNSFGDRFTFDAQLIHILATEFSPPGTTPPSSMLVPRPSQTRDHQTVAMPSYGALYAHAVDIIHFPGSDYVASLSTFADCTESASRFTWQGWKRRFEWLESGCARETS
jgi:hypothetical protein